MIVSTRQSARFIFVDVPGASRRLVANASQASAYFFSPMRRLPSRNADSASTLIV